MGWSHCEFSKGAIDAAGQGLITLDIDDPRRDHALEIINNWRSCHGYPLRIITSTLRSRAQRQIAPNALIARRIKRLASIAVKLRHNPAMKLSQMQDIGGCRAILNSVVEVDRLVEVYRESVAKHPNRSDRPYIHRVSDYIARPKEDGYRGIHLIAKYFSHSQPAYNGQRIEIQIRSKLQHAWATSVEICQAFTGQALKAKVKTGSANWIRFFSLMSAAIAEREKRPLVPKTPEQRRIRKSELKELEQTEKILLNLTGWNEAMQHSVIADDNEAAAFLLELNTRERILRVKSYSPLEIGMAHADYLNREKATEGDESIQVVLVSADSVASVRRAYPNFYIDSTVFIRAIEQEIA